MSADPASDSPAARKREVRAAVRARRRARGQSERDAAALAIARHGLALVERMGAGTIACYLSTPSEPGTRDLIDALRERGHRVLLPRPLDDGKLEWVEAGAGERPHQLGVPEPLGPALPPHALNSARLVFVPAAAATLRGDRLGWGGGYYDRALTSRATSALAIAILYDDEIIAQLPLEGHDAPIDGVLSPRGYWARRDS